MKNFTHPHRKKFRTKQWLTLLYCLGMGIFLYAYSGPGMLQPEKTTVAPGSLAYCTPSGTGTSYYIKNFSTTGGFLNITNMNTGIGTGGYSNSTTQIVRQAAGGSFNFAATYSSGTYGLAIWVDWNGNTTFEASERVFNTTEYGSTPTGTITIPAATANGSYRMRVLADYNKSNPDNPCTFNSGNGEVEDYTLEVGDPPSCMPPTDLGAGNITLTSAQLSWMGEGTVFDVEYGPSGFTLGTGTQASSVANPYNATGLTSDRMYQFYVRRDCGAGDKSVWAGPFSFYPGYCLPAATSTSYFIKDFTTSGGVGANISNTNTGIGTGGYSNHTAMKVQQFETGTINFSAAYSSGSGFAIWVDWNNNMAFDTDERVFNTTAYGAAATGSFTVPAGTPVGNYRMRIRMDYNNSSPSNACTFNSGNGEAEDYTLEVITPPSCMPPSDLGAGNITFTTAQLSWLGDGTLFDVEYGPAGFTQGTGTMASSVANPYDATALTPDTAYHYYVRRDCGAGNKSPWAGPFRFYTGYCVPAATSTSYFIKDFVTTGGFSNINNTNTSIGTGGYTNYANNAAMKVSYFEGGSVSFRAAYSGGSGFAIWVDWNKNMAFDADERVFNTTAYGAAATGTIAVPAGTPVGNYRMRIRMDYNNSSPSDACGFNSGNGEAEDYTFEVVPTPSCLPPTDLGVGNTTFTSAQFSWLGDGTQFDVEYGPAGFTQGTGTMASSVANPYDATALTPETSYEYYVRKICGGNKSSWAGPFRFYTGYCVPAATSTSYFIKDFTTTGGITNINNVNTTIGTGGYSNFTTMKVRHYETGVVNFSAAYSGSSGFAMWIDWNKNMAFDADERVYNTTAYGAAATGSFTIPAGTPVGEYRLRIRMDYNNSSPSDACGFNSGNGEAEDYTLEVVTPPTCMPPTQLGAGNILYTTAQFSWMSEGTLFDIEYGPAGFTQGTGTIVSSVANPYNATGLTADTAYHYYVRRDCGAGDKSPWAGPFRFFTGPCKPAANTTSYFIKNFTTTGGFININNLNTGFGTGGYSNYAAMKVQQFTGGVVNFSAAYSTGSGFSIWVDWNNNMTFEASERVFNTTAYGAAATGTITVPAGTALGSYRMRIMMDNNTSSPNNPCEFVEYEDWDWGDVYYSGEAEDYTFEVTTPPTCMPPTDLGAGNMTFTTAQLSWLGEGTAFDVEYGPTGFTQGTGTVVSSVGNPYNATGLTSDTNYQYYVRRDCGSGDKSPWAGPFSFRTGYCMPTATSTSYFIRDFSTTEGYVNIVNTGTTIGTGGYSNFSTLKVQQSEGRSISFSAAYSSGSGFAIWVDWNKNMAFDADERVFNTSAYGAAATGTFTVPAGTPVGSYRMRIRMDYNNSSPSDACGFNSGNGEAEDYTIEVIAPPSCIPPSNLGIASMTSTSALLSWTSDGTLFDVEYGTAGFTQGTGTTRTGVANPLSITNLTADTAYQFYVRKDCGSGDKSLWAGPFRFTTAYCTPAATSTSYYISSFTTTGGATNISNTGTTIGTGGYSNHTAMKVQQYEGASIDFSATYIGSSGFAIWIDWNNNMAFEASERVFSTTAYGSSATGTITVPALTPVGNYRMRIRMDYNNSTPTDACSFNSGNGEAEDYTFEVVTPPACPAPTGGTAGSLTTATAQLSWISGGTLFDIEYGPRGFTQGTGTMAAGVANQHTVSGLSANTPYQFFVRRDCGADGKSNWAGPFAFRTACGTQTVPYLIDFEDVTTPEMPSCTSIQNAGTGNNWKTDAISRGGFNSKVLNYGYNSSNPANAWFYTNGIQLEPGTNYVLKFQYANSGNTSWVESMKVNIGASADFNAMTRNLVDYPSITNDALIESSTTFTVETSGVYYIGFNAYSITNRAQIYVDNISIDTALSNPDFDATAFKAYPNPVKNILNLSYSKNITDVAVFNLIGQQVMTRTINDDKGQIDMSGLPSGTYMVKVTADNAVKTIKIIKQD
ncbi:GEVED domain-containing protein [Flavobacterium microcysteis]|uniref:T9SS type A sorting domain-containing protein n=1 Tax=Flavobacterium microcysteis TaxID=2596891 RepID=A0A501QCU2_9FLAO|nr:GEVED domain-containing protein [Flavobacterium microcysteis]TPD70679.1 T9SS type A sorting domain-containing protein [Flavobacterium microcysteis]